MTQELDAILASIDGEVGRVEDIEIELSPTIWRFVRSDADLAMLVGPRGEGKSIGGVARILYRAGLTPAARPLKVGVVRDTFTNLERSTIPTLAEGHQRGWWDAEFINGGTEVFLNGNLAHLYLLGMDRPADANKFQGLELGYVWLEEPAPAADLASGVPVDVLAMAMSSLRQPGVRSSAALTMNAPDADHWTMRLAEHAAAIGAFRVETFWIPPGENRHLPEGYRERMRAAFEAAGRHDLVQRLVEGRPGLVALGEAVTPEFGELHIARDALVFSQAWPIIRSWDAGLNPTCIWATTTPLGRLHVLGCRVGENIGMEQFIQAVSMDFEKRWILNMPGNLARRLRSVSWRRGRQGGCSSPKAATGKLAGSVHGDEGQPARPSKWTTVGSRKRCAAGSEFCAFTSSATSGRDPG